MKKQFQSKSVPRGTRTIWRYLGALFLLFTFAVGNVWADTQTYSFASSAELNNFTYTAGDASDSWNVCTSKTNSVEPRDGGFVQYKCGKSNKIATFVTASSFDNISNISFYIASSDKGKTQVKIEVSSKADFSSDVTEIVNASTGLVGLGVSSPANNTWYSVSKSVASKSGYVRFTMTASSSGKYWSFDDIVITYTPSSGGDPVCPSGLTISSKDSKTAFTEGDAIELTASLTAGNGDISYQWYKGGTAEGNKLTGKTTNKLQIASCTTSDAGSYYCVASKAGCDKPAVNASAFAITVAADPKCFNMPAITSKPADLASVTVTGGTLSDVSTAKAVAMNANGLKLDGNSVYLKVTLADASIVEDTKITVAWKGAGSGAGIAVVNGDLAEKVIDETGVEAAGSVTHTFTAAEAANYADEFIIHRNASGTGIYVNAITVEDCGPAVTKHTVTLNYNDGETPNGSLTVVDGNAAVKPADPTRGKYTFLGWFVGDTDNEYVWSTPVTGDLILKAHWQDPWTITFDADGGSEVADITVKHNTKAEKPTDPTKDDNDFLGWFYGNPAVEFDWDANVTQNYALVAHWQPAVAKYDVEYYDGDTKIGTEPQVWANQHPTAAGIETSKPLCTFVGWYLTSALEGDPVALNTVTPVEGLKLYGKWTKAYATSYDMEAYAVSDGATLETLLSNLDAAGYAYTNVNGIDNGHTHNYIYDGMKYKTNDGDLSFNVNAGKLVIVKTGNLPANALIMYINGVADPTVFVGANEAVETHVNNYFYSEAEALYRLDIQASKGTCAIKAVTITDPFEVSYDADGGDPVAAQYGEPYVTLPSASKGTESFLGWFDGETKVGEAGEKYTPTANITLKAHWEAISTDARLASITFSSDAGTLSPTFDPEVTNYTYTMPYGTASVPTITGATSVSAKAQEPVIVQQAAAWNETAIIRGKAQSGDTKAYNVTMKMAPKDGVEIIRATHTGAKTANVTGTIGGTYDKNTQDGGKLGSNGHYLGIKLAEGSFLAGDVVKVVASTLNGGNTATLFSDKGENAIASPAIDEASKTATHVLTGSSEWIYLYRATADCNPTLGYIAVYRPMNPMLTAITINGEAGTINESAKTVAVELQPGYDLAALTIVPTIVSNTAEADVVKTVESNGGAWVIGDNTYRLTDKDGDYTDYTITLSVGVLKHTVSFNTHGGSTIDDVEVEDGQKLTAAPADPTKEDYLFQGWSETDGGSIVDVTTITISADKEFHAVWAPDGAIKLLDGATVNHTNFITGVTADETVAFMGNNVNYAKFSGTVSGVNGVKDLTRVIAYNATTNKTKIRIYAHNNSTSGRNILVKGLVEGASAAVDLATIALGNKEDKVSDWIEFDNAANRTIYIMVSSSAGDVYFTQVKVIESGETPMKQAGEAGYSLNFNKGRFFGPASTDLAFEGLNARLSGDYTALNSGYAKLNATSMSFTVASAMTLSVTANNSKTYYVTKDAAGTDNETAKSGVSEFDLTAGTWYITAESSEVQFTNIAFTAPKCEQPTVVDMENIGLCEGDAFTPLTVSASVPDGGTLHYQWYKHPADGDDEAVGTDAASYTPEADGQYYVVVTNQLADHSDNSKASNIVTVEHFASAVITTAPLNQRATVGNNVTLSVAATGKNVAYKWYTCDENGSNEVALDPEQTDTSIEVTITAGLLQWYKVKVTSDCGNAEAMAKVEEFVPATPANVTTSMVWDWKSTTAGFPTASNSHLDFANTSVEELFADVDAAMPNNAEFRSDMLYGIGQYAWRNKSDGEWGFQGTQIRFHSDVAGLVRVYFRAPSSGQTSVVTIDGKPAGTRGNSWGWSEYVEVPAAPTGDGIVIAMTNGETGMTRVQKIEFLAENTERERTLAVGNLGTTCIENECIVRGAEIYAIQGKNEIGKIVFDQLGADEVLEAGHPYVMVAKEANIRFFNTTAEPAIAADEDHGLIGTFTQQVFAAGEASNGLYFFKEHALWAAKETGMTIPAYRCYLNMNAVGAASPNPLPGRKRMMIGVNGAPAVTTGLENAQGNNAQVTKVLINGQLFILRGEKMYDAKGQLVK